MVGLIVLLGVLAIFILPPLRQPQEYHLFADRRAFLGIPNFLNVASNAGFVIVGLAGIAFLLRKREGRPMSDFLERAERMPYMIFFLGVVLTGISSMGYHWRPNDSTLTWDRLSMTVIFMSLLAATVAERIDLRVGRGLLVPLLLAGASSVWYWRSRGNLCPYALTQYFSILLVGLLLGLFAPRYSHGGDLVWAGGIYALAKLCELLDARLFAITRIVSGHTLKHLVAAFALYWILRMLVVRKPLSSAGGQWGVRPVSVLFS
jgi:hypothetical protein